MNQGDQMLLARTKLENRIREREVQIRAKLDSLSLSLNEYVQGGLDEIKEDAAKVLFADLLLLMADYREARASLSRLGC